MREDKAVDWNFQFPKERCVHVGGCRRTPGISGPAWSFSREDLGEIGAMTSI